MFPNAATRRRNMDASYTALRLCCRVYGTSHPRTREALEDTRVTDPQGWVPLLLAGLAYPSLTKPPGVMKGSKQEAEVRIAMLSCTAWARELWLLVRHPHAGVFHVLCLLWCMTHGAYHCKVQSGACLDGKAIVCAL
jgi:hypothetical protein